MDLPEKNRTRDSSILHLAKDEERTLVTKDADFQISFELGKGPPKLLLVTTGNVRNAELLGLFGRNWPAIFELLQQHHFIEINQSSIIVHR